MLFAKALALCLIPFAVASPVLERASDPTDSNPVVQALVKVRAACKTLNGTLNGFTKNDLLGFPKAIIIQEQANSIQTALQNLLTQTKNTKGQFSDAVTNRLAGDFIDFEPEVGTLLNNIVVHKPAFGTAVFGFGDVSATVLKDLQTLRGIVAQIGQVLPPKLTQGFDALAPGILADILGFFDTAIAAYKKCTGAVCLPPLNALFPPIGH